MLEPKRIVLGILAVIVALATLSCQKPPGNDLLIMRDESQKRGALESCSGEICLLSGSQIPQSSIFWIGLGRLQPPPPSVRDPVRNELHLVDSTVHSTGFVAVDPDTVFTDHQPYPRKSVAWIHLVPPSTTVGTAPAPSGPSFRAVETLTVNETFPKVEHPCRSTGSRQIAWQATIPQVVLISKRTGLGWESAPSEGRDSDKERATEATLFTPKPGVSRFETFESRVVTTCASGAFSNMFGGTPFQLFLNWDASDDLLWVKTKTEPLDEGEGGGYTYLGCSDNAPSEELELGGGTSGSPHYPDAQTKLRPAEKAAILAHKTVRVQRSIDRRLECPGFGGNGFRVHATLDVQLTPIGGGR